MGGMHQRLGINSGGAGDDVALLGAAAQKLQRQAGLALGSGRLGGGLFTEGPEALFSAQQRQGIIQPDVLPTAPAVRRKPACGFLLTESATRALDFDFLNQRGSPPGQAAGGPAVSGVTEVSGLPARSE
jgi:hypothetical protein